MHKIAQIELINEYNSNKKQNISFFYPMLVAVRLATNYEKISIHGTATILLSKHISCIAIDKL